MNAFLYLAHQCVVNGHFKGVVWSYNKSQQVSLREYHSKSDPSILLNFKKSKFCNVLVSVPTNLFVFEDLLKNSTAFSFHLLAVLLLHSSGVRVDVAEDEMEL